MSGIQPGRVTEPLSTTPGLTTAIRTTTMTVTDVATPLPAVPLANRQAIAIVNLDAAEVLYIGNSNVTADRVAGNTAGWEVNAQEGFNLDVTDTIVLYGIAEAGQSILVKIMEIA